MSYHRLASVNRLGGQRYCAPRLGRMTEAWRGVAKFLKGAQKKKKKNQIRVIGQRQDKQRLRAQGESLGPRRGTRAGQNLRHRFTV